MDHPPQNSDISGIRVPMLISGIFNTIATLGWMSTFVFAPIGVPLLVLAVFELIQFSKLGDPPRRAALLKSTQVLGILQICTLVTGNVVSFICGIFVLSNLHRLTR